ncbi:hypothetical protein [Arvimicrobium flavum]|uniref:hypothetical protein n=1 Tax=Arvimicrobium flavum TaxID=3393320 RepID=UPI00237A5345|nr:hypothetical protein [Mesorhizobium shangrilense]
MSTKNRFFRNALNAFIAVRERQAAAYVNGVLLSLDDETLAQHGYVRSELARRPTRYSMY